MAKIAAVLGTSADGFAVRTSLVAGGGYAAGSQGAYSLGSCAVGQTDGRRDRRIDRAILKCPLGRMHNRRYKMSYLLFLLTSG